MSTNLLVTLVWTITTNATVVSRVQLWYPAAKAENGFPSWTPGGATRTTRYDVVSNLHGSFQLRGQVFSFHLESVPVTNWTEETTESMANIHFLNAQ